jgi:predicted TIM-barrel fold metal-dependent hydrolase
MDDVGIDNCLVSSTSMCEENYAKVINELKSLIKLGGERILPVLWITPKLLENGLADFIESGIQWRCLKVHPQLHPQMWSPDGDNFSTTVSLARKMSLPLLIHTSNEPCCQLGIYESLIDNNRDVIFILAHGRPLDQAISIAKRFDNALIDSAFMPVESMKFIIDAGLQDKLLWGTDMFIPAYYHEDIDVSEYYREKLSQFRVAVSEHVFRQITSENAKSLFF